MKRKKKVVNSVCTRNSGVVIDFFHEQFLQPILSFKVFLRFHREQLYVCMYVQRISIECKFI